MYIIPMNFKAVAVLSLGCLALGTCVSRADVQSGNYDVILTRNPRSEAAGDAYCRSVSSLVWEEIAPRSSAAEPAD